MKDKQGMVLGVIAIAVYILGGIGIFGGIAMISFMSGRDLYGWGDGRAIGYLVLCVSLCISIFGVILMRVFRNRGLA